MSINAWHIPEQNLLFGDGHRCPDPKLGIASYGPYRTKENVPDLQNMKIGVVGDNNTIDLVTQFIRKSRRGFHASEDRPLEWPRLPAVSSDSKWSVETELRDDKHVERIPRKRKLPVFDINNKGKRVSGMANVFVDKIEKMADQEPEPDVIICAIPKDVNKKCGLNLSKEDIKIDADVASEKDYEQERLNSFVDDAKSQEEVEEVALDLRAATKARTMHTGIPVQFLSETLLENVMNNKGSEHHSKKAWNIWSALYYKAGAYPWRLPEEEPNTCYVGISFYKEEKIPDKPLKTAMAQVFTRSGNTVIIKGLPIKEQEDNRRTEMGEEAIETLMTRVKQGYRDITGSLPNRLVVHKTSGFSDSETNQFVDNLGGINQYDLVHIQRRSRAKLFRRHRKRSVLRGTVGQLTNDSAILYTTGRKPYYEIYDGFRIPHPLTINHASGDASMNKIATEILQLSKVNYNNARFSQRDPFTLTFADKAGAVFKDMGPDDEAQSKYRFYM